MTGVFLLKINYRFRLFFFFLLGFSGCSSLWVIRSKLDVEKVVNISDIWLFPWLINGMSGFCLSCFVVWVSILIASKFSISTVNFLLLYSAFCSWCLICSHMDLCVVVMKWFGLMAIVIEQFIKALFRLLEQVHTVEATFYYSVLGVLVIGKRR